jgi:cell division septum initiation protein DivIVA
LGVRDRLSQLTATVRGAKTMPMSASCLVNRAEILDALERILADLPADLEHRDALLSDREAVLAAAREQAERILEDARGEREQLVGQGQRILLDALAERERLIDQGELSLQEAGVERERLVEQSDLLVAARARAATVHEQSCAASTRLLADADDYVDRKLAEFEVLLGELGAQVNNGRLHLTARREADLACFEGATQGDAPVQSLTPSEHAGPAFG